MKQVLPLVLLAALSLAGEFVCRSFARGGDQERLLRLAAANLPRLPDRIGPWRAAKAEPISDDVLRMLGCRAHESRIYVDDSTGEQVGLMLLAGSAGPLVSHTAEICYGSVDYDVVEGPTIETIRGEGARADVVHRVTFRSRSLAAQKQRVLYAWRKIDGPWQAPESPRLALGGQPMLYKLQLAGPTPPEGDTSLDSDPTRRFLLDLLPVLDKTLSAR